MASVHDPDPDPCSRPGSEAVGPRKGRRACVGVAAVPVAAAHRMPDEETCSPA